MWQYEKNGRNNNNVIIYGVKGRKGNKGRFRNTIASVALVHTSIQSD